MSAARTRRRSPLHWLSAVVLLTTVVATVVTSVIIRNVVRDQDERLLHARAAEAAFVVGALFDDDRLHLLASLVTNEPDWEQRLRAAAAPTHGEASPVAVVSSDGSDERVVLSTGGGLASGSVLSGPRAALVRRARGGEDLVSGVVGNDNGRQFGFAIAASENRVLYQEATWQPEKPIPNAAGSPFSDLDGALYASSRVDPATLVLTTTAELPLAGRVASAPLRVGADDWTVVVRSKEPLVGALAAHASLVVLLGGLAAALLMSALVEVLARRRRYALKLVDERTAELREAQQIAEAASQSKSEFLSRMSHELRTPLNAVLGFAQVLELEDLDARQRDAVGHILRGGRHLLGLINEVLDIARIETGNVAISNESVSVTEAVTDALDLVGPLAAQQGIRVAPLDEDGSGVHVRADRQRLRQVLLNLLGNAIKYNRPSGSVDVDWAPVEGGRLRITVTDTGTGIAPEHMERLWVPFERLGAEQTGIEGTGVGLALSRRLVDLMGGTIGVDSTVGRGSTFWIELPIVEAPIERLHRMHGTVGGSGGDDAERRTILYIEDNLSNLELIEALAAGRADLTVIAAMQGRLGLQLAREHRPAVVLLDLHLPDMAGAEVLRELRAHPATAGIPVIIVSADATQGQIQRLLETGATAYLTKPLDVEAFMDALDASLATSPG